MADEREEFPESVNTVTAEDGTTWVEIASTGNEDEATLLKGFLDAQGIAAQVENVKFTMEPINFGTLGDIRIYVESANEEKALEILRSRELQSQQLDDDGSMVMTDDGPAEIDENARAENDDGAVS